MSQWDALIEKYGQQYNVDPKLIASVIQVESAGNPKAVSSAGALGLGQHLPSTAKALGIDPTDPEQSIEGTAKLLDENLRRYGNAEQAILAYHGGTDQSNWGPKTQDYLRKISTQYGVAPKAPQEDAMEGFASRFGLPPEQSQPAQQEVPQNAFQARFGAPPSEPQSQPAQAAPVAAVPAQQPAADQPAQQRTSYLDRFATGQLNDENIALKTPVQQQAVADAGRGFLRGVYDVADKPSEWLAQGAESSGLTGLLGRLGINMPTADQQRQINSQDRAAYEATDPGLVAGAGRLAGNIAGVTVPIAGAEAGIARAGGLAADALGVGSQAATLGRALGGQSGLLSRVGYNAAQGAAGGALLSGEGDTGDSAALGAMLGGSIPVAGATLRYGRDAARALTDPFTSAGQARIAQRALQGEAAKDASNLGQQIAADDAVRRAAASGRVDANFDEIIPGSKPTLAQATGNGGVAALERAAMSRAPNAFAERQLSNYQARNAYLTEIKGTPDTLAAAVTQRDEQALPYLRSALENAKPANSTPVVEEIDKILAGRAGQRDDVVKALGSVRSKVDRGELGVENDVEQLYGIRQSINDQLSTVSGRDNSASQLASRELIQVRDKLDDVIQGAAPGFKDFLKTYAELSKPIDAQRYLQGLDLTDQTSQRITLNKVKSALNKIDKQRSAPGASEAKSISDDQLSMLRNLQTDLQREANSSRGMAIGSNTFQNLATNQLIDSLLPGGAGAIAPVTPAAAGGALGYILGGAPGAAIGSLGAQQAAGVIGRAMNARGPEVEARLIDYLLNPSGAIVLKKPGNPAGSVARDLLLNRAAGSSALSSNPNR